MQRVPRRWRVACRFAWASVLVLGTVVPLSAEPPSYAIEQIVLNTDPAPGTGGTFQLLGAPSINAHDAIAFNDGFGFGIFTTADGRGVGPLVRAVGRGDVPPGILGPFGGVAEPSLNDDGTFAFRGFGTDSWDRGIYLRLGSGGLRLVADASIVPPGSSEPFLRTAPGIPLANDGNHVLFSHATASTRGVYRADFVGSTGATSLAPPVILDSGFLQSPGSESPLDYSMNDPGSAVMVLLRADFTRALYAAQPDGSLVVLVAAGDPAPGGGSFTSNLGAPSINRRGDVAFQGDAGSGSTIFIRNAGGTLAKVVDGAVEVPNHPGTTFWAFRDVSLADDGTVVFLAAYRLDEVDYQGIYRTAAAGLKVVFDQFDGIVVNGQPVSLVRNDFGFPFVLPLFLAPRFVNDSFDVAFLQQLPPDNPFGPPKAGIFIARAPAEPVFPVTIDIKPGTFPNRINLRSNGTLPVAVLSTPTFDAAAVDPRTVTLADALVKLGGNGAPMASLQDVNEDGLLDLLVHIGIQGLEMSPGDTQAILKGKTFSGVTIQGVDSVELTP